MTESAGLLQRLRGVAGMTDSFGGAVKPDLTSASDIDQLREQMRLFGSTWRRSIGSRACCGTWSDLS